MFKYYFGGLYENIIKVQEFLSAIASKISSKELIDKYRLHICDFTRHKKMDFKSIFGFILSCPNHTLAHDLRHFLRFLDPSDGLTFSKQAFSAARQHISPDGFYDLFRSSYQLADQDAALWHGHCLKAIDGTTLRLHNTEENKSVSLTQKNQFGEYAMAKVSALYDISHDLLEDVVLTPCRESEKVQAITLLGQGSSIQNPGKRPIVLFDRGYPSRGLIAFLYSINNLFLMRCPNSFLKSVNLARLGDTVIYFQYKKMEYPLRVIKFLLPGGQVETLLTNLFDEDYGVEDFKELYFKRWGIEGKYRELKVLLKIENF